MKVISHNLSQKKIWESVVSIIIANMLEAKIEWMIDVPALNYIEMETISADSLHLRNMP